jgi:hypothetical protein
MYLLFYRHHRNTFLDLDMVGKLYQQQVYFTRRATVGINMHQRAYLIFYNIKKKKEASFKTLVFRAYDFSFA